MKLSWRQNNLLSHELVIDDRDIAHVYMNKFDRWQVYYRAYRENPPASFESLSDAKLAAIQIAAEDNFHGE